MLTLDLILFLVSSIVLMKQTQEKQKQHFWKQKQGIFEDSSKYLNEQLEIQQNIEAQQALDNNERNRAVANNLRMYNGLLSSSDEDTFDEPIECDD